MSKNPDGEKKVIPFIDIVKKLGNNISEDFILTEQKRFQLLGIEESVDKIRGFEFERINYSNEELTIQQYQIIPLERLIGINRTDKANNWIEMLLSLHKKNNFKNFTRDSFQEYVNSLDSDNMDLPEVVEDENGNYFISGGGKHRLTIAKCIGMEFFPVLVRKIES